jgi:tRNA-splicing ligase RtcB (3'-phosphate/5'-hydroxy nucleic acid ligase)
MTDLPYIVFDSGRAPVKAWVKGVPIDDGARRQLENTARLPFIHSHVAAMPDVHFGLGATIGLVIATKKAIIPAAVGVDIGCGMMAVRTSLEAHQLPDSLAALRSNMEAAVPHGGVGAKSGWRDKTPPIVTARFENTGLADGLERVREKHKGIHNRHYVTQLGTLGGGNHFIELCLDEKDFVWVMLHSGSRGIGNAIGRYFIERAREKLSGREAGRNLPDRNLAWLEEGEQDFIDYVEAVSWAQDYARINRELMMERILGVMRKQLKKFKTDKLAINCHHNYVQQEHHFGADVWVTRKGAVRAGEGELGIIPGSMGTKSFIVRGKGSVDSFCSCSHGAGRVMSRTKAKQSFTLKDHREATAGVECRKDKGVIDETPKAYKDIDQVMNAQKDLVEILHTLKQVVCIKG